MPPGLPTARIRRAPESYGRRPFHGRLPERLTQGRTFARLGKGDGNRQRALQALGCIGQTPAPLGEAGRGRWGTRGLGTTLRTSSASVIASPLGPVHLAAVATDCRENVEAAKVLDQLLRHLPLIVGGLPQHHVASRSCGRPRRTLFLAQDQKRARLCCRSVHGSLLGTARGNGFWLGQLPNDFPSEASPRPSYNRRHSRGSRAAGV